mgnify:CR=1 FL=1
MFSILRGSHMDLRKRVAATLDLESGLNDPVAVILTMSIALALVGQGTSGTAMVMGVVLQLLVGAAFGLLVGGGGRWLLTRLNLQMPGLYPVLTLALALLAFSAPTLLQGSGYLALPDGQVEDDARAPPPGPRPHPGDDLRELRYRRTPPAA